MLITEVLIKRIKEQFFYIVAKAGCCLRISISIYILCIAK